MKDAISSATRCQGTLYTLDMSMQMTSRGVKNDFDEMLRRKREMESTAKALHIELQNALLLCSKMEEENKNLKLQNWKLQEKVEALGEASCLSKYRWSNDSVSILQSKLDNDFSSQGMNTFTTDVVNDYEAMIARLEERLIDANDSIKFLKDSIETKSNALSKARTKNDVLSKENEIVQLHNLKLKQKQDAMSKKVMELQGNFRVFFHPGNSNESFELNAKADAIQSSDVYIEYVEDLIDLVMIGGRTSIFAYGRQDSEKYERMRGNDKEKGVLIRVLQRMFELQRNADEFNDTTLISLCAVEVSCDKKIRKLLADESDLINITESSQRFTDDSGSSEQLLLQSHYMIVESIQEMLQLIEKAYEDLENSSHTPIGSHVLFSCKVDSRNKLTHEKSVGLFTFVDLAMSESLDMNGPFGLYQSQNINRSLVSLCDLLESWMQSKRVIPYRNSQLSVLLQNSLGRDSSYICLFLFSDGSNLSNEENAENKGKDFFLQTWLEKSHFKILC